MANTLAAARFLGILRPGRFPIGNRPVRVRFDSPNHERIWLRTALAKSGGKDVWVIDRPTGFSTRGTMDFFDWIGLRVKGIVDDEHIVVIASETITPEQIQKRIQADGPAFLSAPRPRSTVYSAPAGPIGHDRVGQAAK
jgi:hypothetical protein